MYCGSLTRGCGRDTREAFFPPIAASGTELTPQLAAMSMRKLADKDIPCLQNKISDKYKDHLGRVVARLPPLCEVNHRIPLVDKGKQYSYHLPHCLDSLKDRKAKDRDRLQKAQ